MAVSIAKKDELVIRGVPCDPSVFLGAVVKSLNGTILNARANNFDNSNAIGVCIKKISSTLCDVMLHGVTPEIYSSLDATKDYFLSDDIEGGIVDNNNLPSATDEIILKIGRAYDSQRLAVQIGNRLELNNV